MCLQLEGRLQNPGLISRLDMGSTAVVSAEKEIYFRTDVVGRQNEIKIVLCVKGES